MTKYIKRNTQDLTEYVFSFNFKANYQTILVYRYIKERTFISLHRSLIFSIRKIKLQSLILYVHVGDYNRSNVNNDLFKERLASKIIW